MKHEYLEVQLTRLLEAYGLKDSDIVELAVNEFLDRDLDEAEEPSPVAFILPMDMAAGVIVFLEAFMSISSTRSKRYERIKELAEELHRQFGTKVPASEAVHASREA